MRKLLIGLAAAAAFVAAPAHATINSFIAILTGANEVPAGSGDPDGFGIASLVIDDVANTVSWSIIANNIVLPLTGAHIHAGAAGVNGPVIVNFNAQLSGNGLFDLDLASITAANAGNFYVNLHNAVFPTGAIRGQLQFTGAIAVIPEPATYGLMALGLGVVGVVARRRRASAAV
jgi:hypothetical protein